MRSKIPTLFVLTCALILVGAAAGARADTAVQARVLHDSGNRIVLDYDLGDYQSHTVDVGGEAYQEIWFPSEPVILEEGAPALPHVNRSIVIPDDAKMSLKVLEADYHEVFAKIAPSKGNLLRTVNPLDVPYELGSVYRVNAFYPGPLATLGEPYILRDRRGVVVQINPFQYNPVTGVLRVYTDVKVEITAVGPGSVNVLDRAGQPERPSRAFQDLFDSHFLNPDPLSPAYDPLDEEGDMLIICHDPWIPNMAPFIAHKAAMGITANIVGVSTIGNNASSIKGHIQGVYDSSNLAFVLLVGDIAEVASFMSGGGASDPEYSKLAGGDNYPEIVVGRFSAQNTTHLDTQINRTITYETTPAVEQDWFWKGTGIASSQGAGAGDEGQADNVHMAEIRQWLLGAGYTEVDQIYDPTATAGQVSVAVNNGRGVINYCGHGWPQGWSTSGFDSGDVHALVNDNMLPFITSVACNTGEFESYSECFAEAWMRATHNGVPTGAIGMYASSISQSWAPPMEAQDEFNLLLTDPDEPYHTLAAMLYAGSCSMMDDYGSSGVSMFLTWIMFGDPSLRVRGTVAPQGMIVDPASAWSVEGQAGGPFAPESVQYTLINPTDERITFRAAAHEAWISVDPAVGIVPAGGTAVVTLTFDESIRHLDNGTYAGTVDFVNITNHEGDTTRLGALSVGIPVIQQQHPLDIPPFWMRDGEWQCGQPSGQGGDQMGYPDPTGGATGNNVCGVNLDGDFDNTVGGPYYLQMAPMGLMGSHSASIKFDRWLNTEGMPNASAFIEASSDGENWTVVWQNSGDIAENAWSTQKHSIAAVVDRAMQAHVRWGYAVHAAEASPCSGWNIDDIEVWAVPDGTARIALDVGHTALTWTPVQGAIAYDVVQGDLATLLSTGGDYTAATESCVASDVASTTVGFGLDPAPGVGHWYLVRGDSSEGPMSYQALYPSQVGLRDEEINASAGACP
jgi:hypothetical protein